MTCATCRHWRRYPDSDTGVCASVKLNDYASAYLDADDADAADLVTYDDHHCSDYEAGDEAED